MSDDVVIDFKRARERLGRPGPPNPILEALDELGLALVDHDHVWTDRQRALYEEAVERLTTG